MMRPPRPTKAPLGASNKQSNKQVNPFQNVLDDDGAAAVKKTFVDDNDDDSSDDDQSISSQYSAASMNTTTGARQKPPRPSIAPRNKTAALTASAKRRRRRSSARFLQLGGRRSSIMADDNDEAAPQANLSELYQKAIRMNAENKINAGNSWNLQLIENIDKFLEMDEEDEEDDEDGAGVVISTPTNNSSKAAESTTAKKKRVNFTKASCTLDASVKIYSYRVDDVHLTSYKVLANLNRTDTNKKKNGNNGASNNNNDGDVDADGETTTSKKRSGTNKPGSTLETHVANINLNKLDSAFDIDPLFHKMSKTFDEGGAKGLLLVNLGVGANGCNIVFDSSQDGNEEDAAATAAEEATPDDETKMDDGDKDEQPRRAEGMMDITSLTQKLESLLQDDHEDCCGIQEVPLVPQLAGLRAEHEALDQEGFVDENAVQISSAVPVGPKTPGFRRYHADDDEEREADKSIHKEAMERSRMSAGQNLSLRFMDEGDSPRANNDDDNDDFVDFGGGFDDGDDGDDDVFDNFIAADEHGARYSDISFGGSIATASNNQQSSEATTTLLDAIASGQTVLAESDYSYFNAPTLNSNQWAGAAHWKRTATKKKTNQTTKGKKKATKKTPAKRSKKKASEDRSLVSFDTTPNLDALFVKKSKRKVSTQLSKAMVDKHTNQENVLPEDAGFQVEQLTKLFLRPNAVLKKPAATESTNGNISTPTGGVGGGGKTVGFNLPEWDDGSFGGGDDDGPGFDFGGGNEDDESVDDEFLVHELEGVRKVEKVHVGYATVAKKVDVKRLKRDLWAELEQHFSSKNKKDDNDNDDDDEMKSVDSADSEEEDAVNDEEEKVVSFQDAVNEMEAQKTQADATLSFYFICILHLANEKGLRLESQGLEDFNIHQGNSVGSPSF